MTKVALRTLNDADAPTFVDLVGDVFEHSPWIAARAAESRPLSTVEALHAAMYQVIAAAPPDVQREFIAGHPELAGTAAQAGDMTADSVSEQGSAGLDRMPKADHVRLTRLNQAYRERFGFPFVICVRRHTRASILSECERRLANTPEAELAAALREIFYITRLRVDARVEGPGRPRVDGRLSTHVLDTLAGRPASGVRIELRDISDGLPGVLMKSERTNEDGRTAMPLIGGQPLRIGRYELMFHVGDYFRACGVELSTPAFLDQVPVRFSIAEPEGHYHVPLVATPWSYSTYRGS